MPYTARAMAAESTDFIRNIIEDDLRTGRQVRVATRFPPEPNGYLHIGHAKAICVDFGIARDYSGTCNLRFDDTNPAMEDVEYVEAIERDVRWLGFEPTAVLYSADYFPRMYELAERLVRNGNAYVCDLNDEQIREFRGTLSEPGRPSPFRDRSVDDNLDRLRKMKAGEFADGACVLRAKIDMASANMKMRDPLLYRIRHIHHHRTGDAWCIYPMYDYAHPLEDAIEGITHSICTLEFENNRELYDWVIDHTGPWSPRPRQYEFARLALEYTVMSKRKLRQLVEAGHVRGWDDPRMPTLAGLRRRGYSPAAIREFCDMIGVAKTNSMIDIGKLEYCVRDDLNHNAPRALGVLHPIEVELTGADTSLPIALEAPLFPPDIGKPGSRPVALGTRIVIDRDDWNETPPSGYQRLAPGRTVRLRYGPCIAEPEVLSRDSAGNAVKLRAAVVPDTWAGKKPADGRKVSGVIHWVDAATSVAAEVRLYERLFKVPRPEEGGGDALEHLDRDSLKIAANARVEASLGNAAVGSRYQLERVGYFVVDEDSRPGALVLNRIVTLPREHVTSVSVSGQGSVTINNAVVEKPEQATKTKRATRPKSKSPAEYRAEARARDPELAAAFSRAEALGLGADQADLLTGDRTTAMLFLETATATGHADTVAKWMINELPRALGGKELAEVELAPTRFAELLALVHEHRITQTVAKSVLAQMVATGKSARELADAMSNSAPVANLDDIVNAVLAAHPDKVAEYRAGKTGLLGFFIGNAIKAHPAADASAVRDAVRARLG
jgi:glutaminyl-tRNA synthetase